MNNKIYFRLLVLYIFFLFYGCTVPFNIGTSMDEVILRIKHIYWIPYVAPGQCRYSRIDLASNILLYIPFGFFLAFWLRQRLSSFFILFISVISSLFISSFIETIQLFTADRVTSTTDIINNIAGSVMGTISAFVYHRRFHDKVKSFLIDLAAKSPMEVYSIIILFGLIFFRLIPFDVSADVDNIKHNVKFFIRHLSLIPSENTTRDAVNSFLLFNLAAVGIFTGFFADKLYMYRVFIVIVVNSILLCFTEFIKVFIISGNPNISNLFFSSIGTLTGIFAGTFFVRGKFLFTKFFIYFVIVYILFFVFNYLYPFEFISDIADKISFIAFIPFAIYFFKIDAGNISDIFLQIFLFIPMGIIIIRSRKVSFIKSFIAGFICGLIFETLQLYIATRYFDITDAILAGIGTYIGHYCRVGFIKIRISIQYLSD